MLSQIPTEEQYASVMSIIGETPKRPSPRDLRSEMKDILRKAPVEIPQAASMQDEVLEETKPEGWDPNDQPNAMGDFGVAEYSPPRVYEDYVKDSQPSYPSSPALKALISSILIRFMVQAVVRVTTILNNGSSNLLNTILIRKVTRQAGPAI